MKSKNKLKYPKLFIFLIISFFIISPVIVFADATWVMPDPKIKIPGMKDLSNMTPICSEGADGKQICQMPWLSEYIAGIYKYAIGAVAILATVVMMIGGVVWITAAGSQTRIGEAKQWIGGALTGLVLVFSSYMILNFVNPDLVKFKPIKIERVKENTKLKPDCLTVGADCNQKDGQKDSCSLCCYGYKQAENGYWYCKGTTEAKGCCLYDWDVNEWENCGTLTKTDCDLKGNKTDWTEGDNLKCHNKSINPFKNYECIEK